MHEMGVATQLLEVVLARALEAGAATITDVHLEIGEASDVAPGSLELYWPEVSRSTPADGARLHVTPASDPFACRVVAIDVADG